ncbi:MAG: CRR6 family NdhI maturation factor [Leptolyngbya sp. BL-A-14]
MDRDAVFLDFMAMMTIALNASSINTLDLSPVQTVVEGLLQEGTIATYEQQLQFRIEYPQTPDDPRELPEIPEVRLWFIRLDALYPWFPFLLDWKAGELTRYTAMLVPHQFHPKDGIQYNPEALEIFVMHKLFVLSAWMQQQGIDGNARLKAMGQMFGYEIDNDFFALLT